MKLELQVSPLQNEFLIMLSEEYNHIKDPNLAPQGINQ